MPRITRKLFVDLAVWMITLGLLIGISFPFLMVMLGFEWQQVTQPKFWGATLGAGLAAGVTNYLLARMVVRPRLQLLAHHMRVVEQSIQTATYHSDWRGCSLEGCRVHVDSDDEIGDSAQAFNDLVLALFRAREVEAAVADFSKTLSSQLDLDTLALQGLEMLMQHTGALGGVVLIEKSGELIPCAVYGLRAPETLSDSAHVRRAMRTGECEKVELPQGIHIEAVLADFVPHEIMVVPIAFKNTTLGVVILAKGAAFSADAPRLIQLFRQGFGLALNNALAHDNLQRMAALDTLTGIYNRRFGLVRLREEFNRAVRANTALGLLMLDIDHFKSINDTYGHLVGDRVLTRVTEAGRRALREGDFMVRYGGEEFIIVLPGASCHDSHQIGERIRRLIAETIVQDGSQIIQFTGSIGVTSFPEDNVERDHDLIHHADQALYSAKHQGRNMVINYRG
jgi:two-component system, cell cycle response regulator